MNEPAFVVSEWIGSPLVLRPGLLIYKGASLDAKEHAHHAYQLTLPTTESHCTIAGERAEGAVLINSSVPHILSMPSGWVCLVEPQSKLGLCLEAYLAGASYLTLDLGPDTGLESAFELMSASDALALTLRQSSQTDTHLDSRITSLLSDLDRCFEQDCLKPDKWSASELARSLGLSESRFLHLFREQMGIAWRPFLLWRRLMCAGRALSLGKSATEAAYIAGFSDSAHLSRSFRKTFGVSPRDALRSLSP